MNEQWKDFLADAGAVFDDAGGVRHFGNPAREQQVTTTGSVVVPLTHLALIGAGGADAATFLQGQFTNDVRRVDATHSQLSGYCTPKGRLLALLRIFRRDDRHYLQLPAALAAPTATRLSRYVLRAQVQLGPDDSLIGLGLAGPDSIAQLRAAIGAEPPAETDGVVQAGELTLLRVAGIHPRFMIYGPEAAMRKVWAALDVHAAPAGAPAWDLLDILAGVPQILPETVEEFVPQTVNLDLLEGIGFQKGCYTGQEIVARLHYRGTVKRRAYLAYVAADTAPGPGQPVSAPSAGEQAAGYVVTAAPAPDGGYYCLTSLIQEHANAGGLRLQGENGASLELRDLPYLAAGAG